MKTIGLLGGMSWESTVGYYRAINEGVKKRLGDLHSAQIALYSVDFEPLEQMQHLGDWDGIADILSEGALRVEAAGADFLVICTNSMHKVFPEVQAAIQIPILHIADATANVLLQNGINDVGLLGTAFTMEMEFYKSRISDQYGIDVIIPPKPDREIVHKVIYDELCQGKIETNSRSEYLRIIKNLSDNGAGGIILGCTEIGLLVNQSDTIVKLFDTTAIHAAAAVDQALL